jgi:hypothetical protein
VNDELERKSKEMATTKFKALSRHLLEGLRRTMKNLRMASHWAKI